MDSVLKLSTYLEQKDQEGVDRLMTKVHREIKKLIPVAAALGDLPTVEILVDTKYLENDGTDLSKRQRSRERVLGEALRQAARYGHQGIVDYLIRQGAKDLNRAILEAACNMNLGLVKYLVRQGGILTPKALEQAWERNSSEGRMGLLRCYTGDFSGPLQWSVHENDTDLIRYFLSQPKRLSREDLNEALTIATEHLHEPIIELLSDALVR